MTDNMIAFTGLIINGFALVANATMASMTYRALRKSFDDSETSSKEANKNREMQIDAMRGWISAYIKPINGQICLVIENIGNNFVRDIQVTEVKAIKYDGIECNFDFGIKNLKPKDKWVYPFKVVTLARKNIEGVINIGYKSIGDKTYKTGEIDLGMEKISALVNSGTVEDNLYKISTEIRDLRLTTESFRELYTKGFKTYPLIFNIKNEQEEREEIITTIQYDNLDIDDSLYIRTIKYCTLNSYNCNKISDLTDTIKIRFRTNAQIIRVIEMYSINSNIKVNIGNQNYRLKSISVDNYKSHIEYSVIMRVMEEEDYIRIYEKD